jgi:hypothetical protein
LVVDEADQGPGPAPAVEKTSLVGLSRIVSIWVAGISPLDDAVIVGVPTVLSP